MRCTANSIAMNRIKSVGATTEPSATPAFDELETWWMTVDNNLTDIIVNKMEKFRAHRSMGVPIVPIKGSPANFFTLITNQTVDEILPVVILPKYPIPEKNIYWNI